jgi:hypothetical protein
MKICPNCQQTYTDENLNFCLTDGGVLTKMDDAPPPTVMMNQARVTNDSNWANPDPFSSPWQNQPLQQQNTPFQAPQQQNPAYMAQPYMASKDQTLPIVSLVLGILSVFLICCYGGFYFGVAALIVGFIGMNNANKNPESYGGKSLAIAGLVLGGVSFLGTLLLVLIAIAGNL